MKRIGLLYCSILLLALTTSAFAGSIQETKTAKATYDVAKSDKIEIDAKNVTFLISTGPSGVVNVEAEIIYTGKETEKIRNFLDNFQQEITGRISTAGGRLYIDADLDEPFKVKVGRGRRVEYSDEDLKITYTITVPAENDFSLKNSYKDVTMRGKYTGITVVSLYSANFEGEEFLDLEMELKFGKADFRSVKDAAIKLYEQKFNVGDVGNLNLESKFSRVELRKTQSVILDSYESKLSFGELGSLKGKAKFGRIATSGKMRELDLDTYEVDMQFGDVESARFTQSKFCEVTAGRVGSLKLPDSYEDDFTIEELGALDVKSKFNNFEIEKLLSSAIVEGYETDLDIRGVGKDIESISIDGKFNKLFLNSSNVPFHLKGDLSFGDVDFPADKVERKVYIKENSKLEIEVVSKSGPPSLFIDLRGYEMKADIR